MIYVKDEHCTIEGAGLTVLTEILIAVSSLCDGIENRYGAGEVQTFKKILIKSIENIEDVCPTEDDDEEGE